MERQVTNLSGRRAENGTNGPVSGPSAALAELVRASRCTVALTGAGISVPSGIPDFRTPETGLWENVDPMEVAHIDVFQPDPPPFCSYYPPPFPPLRTNI